MTGPTRPRGSLRNRPGCGCQTQPCRPRTFPRSPCLGAGTALQPSLPLWLWVTTRGRTGLRGPGDPPPYPTGDSLAQGPAAARAQLEPAAPGLSSVALLCLGEEGRGHRRGSCTCREGYGSPTNCRDRGSPGAPGHYPRMKGFESNVLMMIVFTMCVEWRVERRVCVPGCKFCVDRKGPARNGTSAHLPVRSAHAP